MVATTATPKRLGEMGYDLQSGVLLLIRGRTSALKRAAAFTGSMSIFDDLSLVYPSNGQTKVRDLLNGKLLCRSEVALLSFVPSVLSKAYTKEGFKTKCQHNDSSPRKIK